MILNMKRVNRARKVRRTFTLSPESLAYLEQEAHRLQTESQSAVLDELLLTKQREQQLAVIEANITAYYDNLSDEEREEERAWGELAEQSLALKDNEVPYDQPAEGRDLVHEIADRPSRKRKAPGRDRLSQHTKHSSTR